MRQREHTYQRQQSVQFKGGQKQKLHQPATETNGLFLTKQTAPKATNWLEQTNVNDHAKA
jgi:hypothetical protein